MALASSTVTATSLSNLVETVYRPRMALATSEAMEIANKFDDGNEGVEKMANSLVIRKILAKNRVTAAAGDHLAAENMTFEADTETNITVSPTFIYGAVGLSKHSQTRLLASAEYQKGVREQLVRTLKEEIDETAGELGDNLATSVIGGAQNLDKSLLLSGLAILRENSKRYYSPGKNTAYLRVHPRQMHHLYSIAEIANANLRGDSDNPNVTGVLVEAWGLDIGISGNIVNSGGFLHNMLFLKEAFVLAYNERPQLAPEQPNGLAMLLMSYAEFGVAEVWDEYAVDVRTNNTAIS